jgi:hypothetical protein
METANYEEVRAARGVAQEAEERRLWYVALTRARDYLVVGSTLPPLLEAAIAPGLAVHGTSASARRDSE